ncbi:MAG: T9SS type A sorting domain-containing protein [Sediminibacterium sp.]|nr:T9SS type A sorting domain-containing protein [Sediminibacterium sp.]
MKQSFITLCMVFVIQLNAQQTPGEQLMNQTLLKAAKFLTGIDGPKDERKAFELYTDCAQKGSAKAMNALGIMYKEGLGVPMNRTKSIEWFTKAVSNGYASGWYNLAMLYKDGKTVSERNYEKAFTYFSKAADLNDEQSVYSKAYFYYKGFGIDQNYRKAYKLFKLGAYSGRPNSMYFLALCYRNGYGTNQNADSARYWLNRAWQKGYKMAGNELLSKEPENSNIAAQELAKKIKRMIPSAPENVNQYNMLENKMPSEDIAGNYKGYIIRYDWSGEHAIGGARLALQINYSGGKLTGTWIEADTVTIPFQAVITPHNLVFSNTQYQRKDHYSPVKPVSFNFENAKLQWERKDDSLYLTGSVQMFSPELNEPQKPLFISLVKAVSNSENTTASIGKKQQIIFTAEDGSPLFSKNTVSAYPNPFNSVIKVDFKLKTASVVETQLIANDGRIVYKNNGGLMKPGNYTITLKPQQVISGTYILKVFYGAQSYVTKVIKL